MLTAAVRELHAAQPGQFQTDVRTSADALWLHNPYRTPLHEEDPGVEVLDMHYPLIHQSNQQPYHFIHGYLQYLEGKLNVRIPVTRFHGDIYLAEDEKQFPLDGEAAKARDDFWIIVAGGKYDFTAKWWDPAAFQQVVDHFLGKIQFVQCGEEGHWHPRLQGVIDLVGKTSTREFVRLMYHAAGVVCPVTFAMHLAAAVETKPGRPRTRPCVVVAGGREPPHWEAYPYHQFISTVGMLTCCANGGCWKSRCQLVGDGDAKDRENLCDQPAQVRPDLCIPRCMAMITPDDVIRKIKMYHSGGLRSLGVAVNGSGDIAGHCSGKTTPIAEPVDAAGMEEQASGIAAPATTTVAASSLCFILSNHTKEELLAAHCDILAHFDSPFGAVIVHSGSAELQGLPYEVIPPEQPGDARQGEAAFRWGALGALIAGMRWAAASGYEWAVFRPGDDWVLNHKWVRGVLQRLRDNGLRFAGSPWFANDRSGGFALNESFYHVPSFAGTLEDFVKYAKESDPLLGCEYKLDAWVRMTWNPLVLSERWREPPIAYQPSEIDLGFSRSGKVRPADFDDRDNNRFFNRTMQLVGDHDDDERLRNYLRIRHEISFADALEKAPRFAAWLTRARSRHNAAKKIRLAFYHGLGDAANFAHVAALYVQRGYDIEIETTPDKTAVFQAAGARTAAHGLGVPAHAWPHPLVQPSFGFEDPWAGNKIGENVSTRPLPGLGLPAALWNELIATELTLAPMIHDGQRKYVDERLEDLPRPLILLHTKANTSADRKDLPNDVTYELYRRLLDDTGGSLVLLDWDNRVPKWNHYRIRHLIDDFPKGVSLYVLWELMRRCDLMIGVDSGPLHFSRFARCPTLGLWTTHYCSHFVLPRPGLLNVVAGQHRSGDRFRRVAFRTVCCPDGDGLTAEFIARMGNEMLAPSRYFSPDKKAEEVQMRFFLGLTDGRHFFNGGFSDREGTFQKALDHLAAIDQPVIVETGCIRAEEDWAGAGFFTYLFGFFVHHHGGQLHSVDLDRERVAFARSWTREFAGRVNVHVAHSHAWLMDYQGPPMDLFYSDSADVGTPEFEECCLKECQLAIPKLAANGKILIDDTVYGSGRWQGKGARAVPWLLANGWKLIDAGYQALLARG